MDDWSQAIDSLNDYYRSSYGLPSDHSLISPIARVVLQKRRLLKMQEIHNLLLKASCEPSETLLQVMNHKSIITQFN